jgi:hypothetical protein
MWPTLCPSLVIYSWLFPIGGSVCSHLLTLVPSSRIFLPWRWWQYVPPKHRLTQDLHSAKSQKTFFNEHGSNELRPLPNWKILWTLSWRITFCNNKEFILGIYCVNTDFTFSLDSERSRRYSVEHEWFLWVALNEQSYILHVAVAGRVGCS